MTNDTPQPCLNTTRFDNLLVLLPRALITHTHNIRVKGLPTNTKLSFSTSQGEAVRCQQRPKVAVRPSSRKRSTPSRNSTGNHHHHHDSLPKLDAPGTENGTGTRSSVFRGEGPRTESAMSTLGHYAILQDSRQTIPRPRNAGVALRIQL